MKKLRELFSFGKKTSKEKEVKPQKGEVSVLLEMEYCAVDPEYLMEPLLLAIVSHTRQPEMATLADIKLYSLYDDGTFIGSFYALEREEGFYGNIVGNRKICFVRKDQFECKETNELYIPLHVTEEHLWALTGKYDRKSTKVTVKCLKKTEKSSHKDEIVHEFDAEVSFSEALAFFDSLEKS